MKLLLSNDDGVTAQGLQALAAHLGDIAECMVVAPDRDRSGASNSLTLDSPLHCTTMNNGFISVNGTPTDCVYLGITEVMPEKPDMVVSGINAGANLGDDVLYSGTVAAALEGRTLGLPSMAISLASRHGKHFETAAMVAVKLVQSAEQLNLPPRTILNVNVPDVPYSELSGFKITRLGHRTLADKPVLFTDPRGKKGYWVSPVGDVKDAGDGTDFFAVKNNYVSITPLQVDMTRYEVFDELQSWVSSLS